MVVPRTVLVRSVTGMAVVHEDMHQRAGKQQQEREKTKKVRPVLTQQKVRGDGAP